MNTSLISSIDYWFTTFSRLDNYHYRYPIVPYGENGARAIHHFIDLGKESNQNNLILAKTFPDWVDYLENEEIPKSVLLYLKRTTPIIGWFIPNKDWEPTKRDMENKTNKKYDW